jgi:sarcosine oxidase subunit delta
MKLLACPLNGVRPIAEFVYAGELRNMPDPDATGDREWAQYVFHRNGAAGVKRELWYHAPSGTWLIAERDTQRDQVLATYLPSDPPR